MDFWNFVWYVFVAFAFVAYLMILFSILTDLFRDRELSGWWKAVWIVFLIFVPLLTSLVYLIARGGSMGERQVKAVKESQANADAYIRNVAGKSPADQIQDAKALLDSGVITQEEFAQLKAKALV